MAQAVAAYWHIWRSGAHLYGATCFFAAGTGYADKAGLLFRRYGWFA